MKLIAKSTLGAGLAVIGSLMITPALWAEDLAVIVANEFYDNQPRVGDTRRIAELERSFRASGFEVVRASNSKSTDQESDAAALWGRMNRAEHLAVVLSGHFVTANGDSFLLHTDAGQPNAFTLGRSGYSVNAMLELAGRRAGQSVVAIAQTQANLSVGDGMQLGFRVGDIPQGAMVLEGTQTAIARFITTKLLRPGQVVADALQERNIGVSGYGYLPPALPYRTVDTEPVEQPDNGDFDERRLWQQVSARNDVDAYQQYLNQYPNGMFANIAKARVQQMQQTPQDRARIAEEKLSLTRNQRRAIQRNLTLIGFDTAGVDGILGPRSRSAISDWQRSIGVVPTGYLSANQVAQIETAGAARAEELRLEAEQRRAEQERQDRNYWGQTGANGSEAGLRAYLQTYPDGLFSADAKQRLEQIAAEQRRLARGEERRAWDQAVSRNTVDGYLTYLNAYPNGQFVQEAKARANGLQNPETPRDLVEAARQEERRLNLDGFSRRLIEAQLSRMDYDTGNVDGNFDENTRRALRQYQRANSMTVTGFVTKQAIVQLLASGIGRLNR